MIQLDRTLPPSEGGIGPTDRQRSCGSAMILRIGNGPDARPPSFGSVCSYLEMGLLLGHCVVGAGPGLCIRVTMPGFGHLPGVLLAGLIQIPASCSVSGHFCLGMVTFRSARLYSVPLH